MRIVIFTGERIEKTPWWPIVLATPELSALLICQHVTSLTPRQVTRRFLRNVRKHGMFFIPYRSFIFFQEFLRRAVSPPHTEPVVDAQVPCERLTVPDLHAEPVLQQVRDFTPDLGLSLGAPILRRSLFSLPPMGTYNLHLGKVPDFRGAPPGYWELATGASEIGATVHEVDDQLDTGPILEQLTAPLYPDDSIERAQARAEELGTLVLAQALARLSRGNRDTKVQRTDGRTFRAPTLPIRTQFRLRLAMRRAGIRLRRPSYLPKVAATVAALYGMRPVRDLWRTAAGSHPVRIFTFHRVTNLCRDGMTVAPDVCRAQIHYLRRTHDIVSLESALALLARNARLRRPVAVLTFDDGYRSVWHAARPLLREASVPGCCFVATDFVGTERRFDHDVANPARAFLEVMNWDELRALLAIGWGIGSHTANHARLSACSADSLRYEVEAPLAALRHRLGLTEIALAFPFGQQSDISPAARNAIAAAGYQACLSDAGGDNVPPTDPLFIRRIELGGDHDTLAWKARVHGIDLGDWWRHLHESPSIRAEL